MSSTQAHNAISNINILHDFQSSDHFPLCITINVDSLPRFDVGNYINSDVCRWHLADNSDLESYSSESNNLLGSVVVPSDLLRCSAINCCNSQHKGDIDILYCGIVSCLNNAESSCVPHSCNMDSHNVPGLHVLK